MGMAGKPLTVRPLPLHLAVPLYVVWAAVAFSDATGEQLGEGTQKGIRWALFSTLATHVGEAMLISRRVSELGYPDQSRKWALSTVLWGFSNFRRVGRLPRAVEAS